MSISVGFITGSKRENSTLQLPITETHNCVFKNGCSMLNPTLLLELNSNDFPNYTGFKIEDRYYFVTDIVSVRNNLFEISGKVDVLATYKSNILATTAYVIFDTVPNTELVDNRLPMKTSKSVQSATTPFPFSVTSGMYILSLTGTNGSTGIYKVTPAELRALIDDVQHIEDNLFPWAEQQNEPTPPQGQSVWEWIQYLGALVLWAIKMAWHPFSQFFGTGNIPENIRECKFIPFNVGVAQFLVDPVYLGTFETRQRLYQISAETEYGEVDVTIPWQCSDYRRRSPYTEVYLYLPYIGMTKLSSENLAGQISIHVAYGIAIRDGDLICTISSGGEILGQFTGNVATSVPVGVSNINMPKAAQALVAGAVSAAAFNAVGTGLAAIKYEEALTPNFSCIGGLDGIAATAANQNITCYTVFHDTNVAPNTEIATIGAPTMAPKSLANLTGYVQTMSASVSGAMTTDERIKLNNLLDSGIYIE